jgi:acyl-CoA oxidase
MREFSNKLFDLLPKIRLNAVSLVDSFGYLDSNLCSALGAFDGNVYERLFDFAKNSQFNEKEVHDAYHKYMRPYIEKQKQTRSKL